MEICVKSFDGEKYTVEVGADDTTADIRRKVASAAELRDDGFDMSFGGKLLAEGDDTTQLSAGDTVVLTKTKSQKDDAIAALCDLGETRLTSERFNGLRDPKLVHLFLQAEVVTEIPNHVLRDETFEELDLSGVPGVTDVGHSFLESCRSLHTADLSGWSNVTCTSSHFLSKCTSLTTLDLSGWNNVTYIGMYFLSTCTALRTLDLSGWNNVRLVDDYFLSYCTSLTTLDISGWNNVTRICSLFLFNCTALRSLDMSGWTSVQHIGTDFLTCNIPTSSINITGSSSVVSEYVHDYSCSLVDDTKCKCVCM